MSDAHIQRICDGNLELAYVVRSGFAPERTTFVTPDSFYQQLGFIVYPKGGAVKPHRHLPVERRVLGTPEVVLVRSGHCIVDIYSEQEKLLASVDLKPGDVIVFAAGGHGFRMQEDTLLMEIKQGPYVAQKDKVHF